MIYIYIHICLSLSVSLSLFVSLSLSLSKYVHIYTSIYILRVYIYVYYCESPNVSNHTFVKWNYGRCRAIETLNMWTTNWLWQLAYGWYVVLGTTKHGYQVPGSK